MLNVWLCTELQIYDRRPHHIFKCVFLKNMFQYVTFVYIIIIIIIVTVVIVTRLCAECVTTKANQLWKLHLNKSATIKLTMFMKQIPSWKSEISSLSKEIKHLLWNKNRYSVHKHPPLDSALIQKNPATPSIPHKLDLHLYHDHNYHHFHKTGRSPSNTKSMFCIFELFMLCSPAQPLHSHRNTSLYFALH